MKVKPSTLNNLSVIWDIDGVLIDSEPLHDEAFRVVCERIGWTHPFLSTSPPMGLSLKDIFDAMQRDHRFDIDFATWSGWQEDHYVASLHPGMARPGILPTIEGLRQRGIPMACVSTAERRIVDANLEILGLSEHMEFSLSRQDVTRTKPDPEPYIAAKHRLGVPDGHIIVVEDSVVGAQSAVAAGLFCAAFPNAKSPDGLSHIAHAVIEHMSLDAILGLAGTETLTAIQPPSR